MSKSGTCRECRKEHLLERGKLVEHMIKIGRRSSFGIGSGYPKGGARTEEDIMRRCTGSGSAPLEKLEKDRDRRQAKLRALIEASRGDAAVMIDAIQSGRLNAITTNELGAEPLDRELLVKRALDAHRLATHRPHRRQSPIVWRRVRVPRGQRYHLHCVFCGTMLLDLPPKGWTAIKTQSGSENAEPSPPAIRDCYRDHVDVCALQILAGIRTPVQPGTCLDFSLGPLFADELGRKCGACGALPGKPCIAISVESKGHTYQILHAEPHASRRYAA